MEPAPRKEEPQAAEPAVRKKPSRALRLVRTLAASANWLYFAAMLALWLTIRLEADRWWAATLLAFGPLWISLLPLLLLLPIALALRLKSLGVLLLSAVIAFGPITHFCVPWQRVFGNAQPAATIRVLTCNIHSLAMRDKDFAQLLDAAKPDVVAIQEWTTRRSTSIFPAATWHTMRDGELFLATRYPIRNKANILARSRWEGSATCYELDAPTGPVYFINLHLASPHNAFDSAIEREPSTPQQIQSNSLLRQRQAVHLLEYMRQLKGPILLAGDFNTPPASRIYRENWSPFVNAFAQGGLGWGYTYRVRRSQIRIDHVLGNSAWQCRNSWVGPDIGSPHRPLIADMELIQPLAH